MSTVRVLASACLLLALVAGGPGRTLDSLPVLEAQAQPAEPRPAPDAAAPSGAPGQDQSRRNQNQDQPQDQPPPVFRAGVNFVRVDVIVTDDAGNPVTDLRPEDFEVIEDGEPQAIETFQLIELDGGLMQGPDGAPRPIRDDHTQEIEAARDDVRLFAIFLDDYHVRWENGVKAREELARFVETQLGPSDMVGLMYPLQPAGGVVFTRDHAAVTRALRQFEGRKFKYEPRNDIEQNYVFRVSTEQIERIRNDVSLSALEALVVRMGSLKEGRKALILFSEGYTYMVPPQLRSRTAGVTDFDNPARNDPNAGHGSLIEQRYMDRSNFDMYLELRELTGMANRNNVAIYGIDPRGLAGGEFDIAQNINAELSREYLSQTMDTIRVLSQDTTGRAIVNRNDVTLAMRQILRDSSAYYLLGYNSTVGEPDGEFHEIRVRLRRQGLQVRARAGYWALKPEEAERLNAPPRPGPPPAITEALAVIEQPARGRRVRTWIGTDRGDAGRSRVTVMWEPVLSTAGTDARGAPREPAPASVALTAAGADGTPYYRGQLPADNPRVTFDASPGEVELRFSIRGPDDEVLDSETRSVVVPDLSGAETRFGTPRLFRARTARALQDLKTNPQAVPTMVREFDRTERLLVRIAAYGPAGSPPAVTARLLNREGNAMSDLQLEADPSGEVSTEIQLAALAAGDYLLEFKASGPGGEATELVGFRTR
jgi:VWFA-related protein